MKKTLQRLKNERGLTLVELLAVIVILAIIAVIAFVFIGGVIENSKKDAHIANAQQAISAAKLHEATTGSFTEITIADLQEKNYLEEKIMDPWKEGNDGHYQFTDADKVVKKGEVFVVSLAGKGCKIEGASEADLSEGRDAVCKKD